MRKLSFLMLMLTLVRVTVHGQFKPEVARYLDEINIAKLLIADDRIDSAIRHYELALACFKEAKDAWFDLGDLYVQRKQYTKAIDAYSNGILNGSFSNEAIHSADYKKDFSNPQLSPFLQRLDSLCSVFYTKKYNWAFYNLISELHSADQAIRNMEDIIVGKDTTRLTEFNRLLALTDTTYNLPRLLDYLDEYPFPKAATLNGDVTTNFWIIVHHMLQYDTANPNVARLGKYILNAVYEGQFDVKGYVMTLDYQQLNQGKGQLYGMFKRRNKEGVNMYYPAITAIESVDKRRAAWHLLPLYLEKKTDAWYPDAPAGYAPGTQEK